MVKIFQEIFIGDFKLCFEKVSTKPKKSGCQKAAFERPNQIFKYVYYFQLFRAKTKFDPHYKHKI